jgi:predicted  nucleic acid-binding Zn-ribbon protein
MYIQNDNMTDEEYFRIHGTLTPERIERLLEHENQTIVDLNEELQMSIERNEGLVDELDALDKEIERLNNKIYELEDQLSEQKDA